jgi:hypothetical protein
MYTTLQDFVAAGAVTIPQRKLMQIEDLGINVLGRLFRTGEVDSLIIGGRERRAVISSYLDYVRRQQLGVPRPEAERLAAIDNYRRSLTTAGSLAAARARSGITSGTRAKAQRTRSRRAVARQTTSPQPEPSPKLRKSSSRHTKENTVTNM